MNKGQRVRESSIAVDVEQGKSYYWCSLGKSSKQPFCDSSHKDTEFNPFVFKAELTKIFFFELVNKLINNPFVTVHTTKSYIENLYLTVNLKTYDN